MSGKKLLKVFLPILPGIVIYAVGLLVFPKNPALHGVFPHPSMVIFLLLFQFLDYWMIFIMGLSLGVFHILCLIHAVDYQQVPTIYTYEFLALPAFIFLFSLVFSLFRYFRQKEDEILVKGKMEDKDKVESLALQVRDQEEILEGLKIKLAMSNQGLPKTLENFIGFWKADDVSLQFAKLIRPFVGSGKFLIQAANGHLDFIGCERPFVNEKKLVSVWEDAWGNQDLKGWQKLSGDEGGIYYRVFREDDYPSGIVFWQGMNHMEFKNSDLYWESLWKLWHLKKHERIWEKISNNNLTLEIELIRNIQQYSFYTLCNSQGGELDYQKSWQITRLFCEIQSFNKIFILKKREKEGMVWAVPNQDKLNILKQIQTSPLFQTLKYNLVEMSGVGLE